MTTTSEFDLSAAFLDIAACPDCHAKLAVDYERGELVCTNGACGLAYPVQGGIPVLLVDQARHVDQD
ncbi:Trm112 family protein [Propionibacterium sp.]|uniref:Trm112 family protein n=1 Tax=Propionibacterium sp. TaxID=1977903 RepID=UPI0039E90FE1